MNELVKNFLNNGFNKGGFSNDDVVAIVSPIFERIAQFHEEGFVAADNFIEQITLEDDVLYLHETAKTLPKLNEIAEKSWQQTNASQAVLISEEYHVETIIGEKIENKIDNQLLQNDTSSSTQKVAYLPHLKSYEIENGHHDALTDIFLLGMLLASFSLNRDLSNTLELENFIPHQNNPFALNVAIHPSIAKLISDMTSLDRKKRPQDTYEIYQKLIHFREQNLEETADLSSLFLNEKDKKTLILQKLRTRLFDISRRNKMLYFQESGQMLNLTYASFPMVLNVKYVRAESLFIWNEKLKKTIQGQQQISLEKYLHFDENPYLSASLNKIRLIANKDKNEYGFSQLKLAIAFLHWHNFKDNSNELISSPLLFVPVELHKKKGIKDNYQLQISDSIAEINPILQYQLKELYNIYLPDTLDFESAKIEDLYHSIQEQISKHQSNISLEFIDKPKIKIIHTKARQLFNQFKRKQKNTQQYNNHSELEYSYKKEQFKPLGLEMFRNYIESKTSHLEFLTSEINPNLHSNHYANTLENSAYYLDEISHNKYAWQFDLCHIVLGNFNYKKMTLVRDYNEIVNQNIESSLLNALFSNEAKPLAESKSKTYAISDMYNVVASDPSQDLAILQARANKSYLIQGPPGTGKSQTITNLVSDFVARGKKVLFVCEKRAALDVVYQRLAQQNLEELCCLIHDSQADKKSFVQDLKKNYEENVNKTLDFKQIENERNILVESINKELNNLRYFHNHMLQKAQTCSSSVRSLLDKALQLKHFVPGEINSSNFEGLPSYQNWEKYGSKIQELYEVLEKQHFTKTFKHHPVRLFNSFGIAQKFPLDVLYQKLQSLLNQAEELEELHDLLQFNKNMNVDLKVLFQNTQDLSNVLLFATPNLQALLDSKSAAYRTLLEENQNYLKATKDLEKASTKNIHWKVKFTIQDTHNALQIATEKEGKLFSFFSGKYRAMKHSVKEAYNFSAHPMAPSFKQVLLFLEEEQVAQQTIDDLNVNFENKYGKVVLSHLINQCEYWHTNFNNPALEWFQEHGKSQLKIVDLQIFLNKLKSFQEEAKFLDWQENKDFNSLQITLQDLLKNIHDYSFFLPYLIDLYQEENELINLLKNKDWSPKELEAALVYRSLQSYLNQHKDLQHISSDTLQFYAKKLEALSQSFLQCNALFVKAKQHEVFNEKIRFSELSTVRMTEEEKIEKKNFLEARKILENEFTKSIRFKSIRSLASDESGILLRELKPVWLMSPLSVSDTLPIQNDFFDVIIYDEASQITLEEGIPALFRAKQTIIVGDKMQMPPSNFFGKKMEEEETSPFENESTLFEEIDSLLDQGNRKLPSVMLQWHYRSRHEALIGFSNAAFYENRLLTIPDVFDLKQEFGDIIVNGKELAAFHYQDIFKRPISFHYQSNGIYENRSNPSEAKYIAELVKHILLSKQTLSIGIVAFSQEQQGEIEDALNEVDFFGKNFLDLMEEKSQQDEKFEEIFIKNLENVQGDERDIIIISTCYGYNNSGKMLMNFGPINKKGGEKRLNVLFSRAKKHMVVVSSIKHTDITNIYNEGANYFKKYLHFAEEMSLGKTASGQVILNSLHLNKNELSISSTSKLVDDITQELLLKGYFTEKYLGQSDFKCHIAIKKLKESQHFDLGIIVDDAAHYENEHIHASYLLKPQIMENFGWKILPVFAKDWYENKTRVLQKILNMLEGKTEALQEESILTDLGKTFDESTYLLKKENYYFSRFEMKEGSSKFWEIALHKQDLIIQFGKIGNEGQKLIKHYASTAEAIEEKRKLIAQKVGKGYVQIS